MDRPATPPTGSGMTVGRMEAFSDGVLAIVITLLILDIKVPLGADGRLAEELGRQWPQYLAYLMSFLIVGTIWLNHHATVALLARADHPTQVLNLLLLLPVSVLPWPTALLASYAGDGNAGDQRVAVVVYGVTSRHLQRVLAAPPATSGAAPTGRESPAAQCAQRPLQHRPGRLPGGHAARAAELAAVPRAHAGPRGDVPATHNRCAQPHRGPAW